MAATCMDVWRQRCKSMLADVQVPLRVAVGAHACKHAPRPPGCTPTPLPRHVDINNVRVRVTTSAWAPAS